MHAAVRVYNLAHPETRKLLLFHRSRAFEECHITRGDDSDTEARSQPVRQRHRLTCACAAPELKCRAGRAGPALALFLSSEGRFGQIGDADARICVPAGEINNASGTPPRSSSSFFTTLQFIPIFLCVSSTWGSLAN